MSRQSSLLEAADTSPAIKVHKLSTSQPLASRHMTQSEPEVVSGTLMPKSCDISHIRKTNCQMVETYLISALFSFLLLFYKTSSLKTEYLFFIFYYLFYTVLFFYICIYSCVKKVFIHVFMRKPSFFVRSCFCNLLFFSMLTALKSYFNM